MYHKSRYLLGYDAMKIGVFTDVAEKLVASNTAL